MLGASLVFGVAACGSSNDDKPTIPGGTDPGNKTEINTELTPEQKKLELDKTAKRALAMVKSTDFNNIENIANYVHDNLSSEHATAKINKWWKDKLKSFWTDLGKREKDMKVMQRMIDLSQINGHFKVVPTTCSLSLKTITAKNVCLNLRFRVSKPICTCLSWTMKNGNIKATGITIAQRLKPN